MGQRTSRAHLPIVRPRTASLPSLTNPLASLRSLSAVCGFGNLASAGINIGILVAMAPNKADRIIRLTPRALFTGILATLSTACVAGLLG